MTQSFFPMNHRPSTRARLGPFVVNVRTGELDADGAPILLPQQVFQVLLILMERERDLVTRDELKKMLWPNDTVVEFEHGINNTVKKLRRALGDSADEPKYIETIPRRGYRLMVPVEWVSSGEAPSPEASSASNESCDADSQLAPKAKLKVSHLTGNVVSHYRVLEVIGGGGMGLVYRAEDLKLGRAVAVKFLPEEVDDDPKAYERFDREARAVSALSHPNICPIYEFAEHDGQPFLVMELLQGKTLRDHLAAGRFRLSQPEGLEVAIQIASGLEAAHEKGIVHRDIKPANIFITEKNVAKILDFGVAKMMEAAEPTDTVFPSAATELPESGESKGPDSDNDEDIEVFRLRSSAVGGLTPLRMKTEDEAGPLSTKSGNGVAAASGKREITLTRTGTKLGTAGYMSPEQIRGEPLDARSDIFSFGLVLYEMATGERAFFGETEAILHDAIEHSEARRIGDLAPELSSRSAEIVNKCLEKNREQRFQTVKEVHSALSESQPEAFPARPLVPPESVRAHRRYLLAILPCAVLIAAGVAGVSYRRAQLPPKLTDQDTVVVGEFANLTSDRLFDNAFKNALEVALGQTPFLNPLSAEKVSQVLKVMKEPPGEQLTPAIAREVCQRTQSAAYVAGSISDSGNRYRLEVNAVDCKTGRTLASGSARAEQQNQIVAKLGDAAYTLREKLGEPAASLQKFNKPLAEATTPSIEALQAYTAAEAHYGTSEAVSDLERAVELDPEFALGYLSLAQSCNILGLSDCRDKNMAKAYRLRERRLSDRDRVAAEMEYYVSITGEYDKLLSGAELAIQEFPRWWKPRNQLGRTLNSLGDYEKSRGVLREALRLSPDSLPVNLNLSRSYIALDRPQEARAVLDRADARIPDKWQLRTVRYVVAFLQNDHKAMNEVIRWAKDKPGIGGVMLKEQSETAAYYGRMREASEFMQQAVEAAVKAGGSERAIDWKAIEALRSARIGEKARARKLAQEAMSPDASLQAKLMTAMAFANAGDTTRALQLEQELRENYPLNSLLGDRDLPSIQAEIYLQQGRHDLAIAVLERAAPYDLGWTQHFGLDVVYVRGEAYLQAGKGQEAIAQFRKMLDHPGLLATSINGPMARLQLARAQAIAGDKEAARKSYEDFLKLWEDADPDIPIYRQAKAEYKRLK